MKIGCDASEADQREQFVVLFARHQRRVYAYIGSLLPHISDADEVMQETSLILWRKWHEFRPDGDFVRWANGIAHREVLRYLRRCKGGRVYFSEDLLQQIADEHMAQVDLQEVRQSALRQCLEKLRTRDRELVDKRYAGEYTVTEIAEQVKRPAKSIYRSLERIRERLLICVQRTLAAGERVS